MLTEQHMSTEPCKHKNIKIKTSQHTQKAQTHSNIPGETKQRGFPMQRGVETADEDKLKPTFKEGPTY